MKLTTAQKVERTRAHVKRWETRLKRAANKLAAYRAILTRQTRKLADEAATAERELSRPGNRKFEFEGKGQQ